MVEITCGSKAPHPLSAEHPDLKKRSLNYTVKRKLMATGSGMVLKGFAFGMALGGLTSAPPAFADQPSWWGKPTPPPPPLTVPKATCGRGDHPETALQGQVPASLRAIGFKGFNCNLELVGQVRGDGANWQSDEFREQYGRGDGRGDGSQLNRVQSSQSSRSHLRLPWHRLHDDGPHASRRSSHRHDQPKSTGADLVPHLDLDA